MVPNNDPEQVMERLSAPFWGAGSLVRGKWGNDSLIIGAVGKIEENQTQGASETKRNRTEVAIHTLAWISRIPLPYRSYFTNKHN